MSSSAPSRSFPSRAKIAALVALLSTACSSTAAPPEPEPQARTSQAVLVNTPITGDSLPNKTIVFTYDDGPDEHTIELAQYLHDQGISATFFDNGRRFCKQFDTSGNCTTPWDTRPCDNGLSQAPVAMPKYYPESILDQVIALGHRVANHSQDHCHLQAETKAADMLFELKTTEDILDRHICDNVFLFRAPYGEWDDPTTALAQATGLDKLIGPIQWDIDGQDWSCWQKGTSVAACGQGYLDILHARPNLNGIFLMHDRPEFNVGYPGALMMSQWLIPQLKADGYTWATLEQVTSLPTMPCAVTSDAGADASGSTGGGDGGTSGSSGGSSSGSSSGTSSGSTGGSSGGSSSTGSSSGSAGNSGSSGGLGGSGGGSGALGGGTAGGSSGSPSGGNGGAPTAQSSGCTCSIGPQADARQAQSLGAILLVAAAVGRRARRGARASRDGGGL